MHNNNTVDSGTSLQPIVSICCMTFNHEPFIRQCLDGFVNQSVNFPIEILVHDDASTDSTASIVRQYEAQYPGLFRCVYQTENKFAVQNMLMRGIVPMARGKYIALCEGDDYWTDMHKLQKQVDFLEAQREFAGCFHETQVIFEDGTSGRVFGSEAPPVLTTDDTLTTGSPFHTSSFVYRNILREYPRWFDSIVSGDMALFSIQTAYGPLAKIPGIMSVYRKHDGGYTNTDFVKTTYHQKRIELMNILDKYHQYRFSAKAGKVIEYHIQALLGEETHRTSAQDFGLMLQAWEQEDVPESVRSVVTMLSSEERKFLYALAKQYWRGIGAIIDAGCFLGGSTLSLASGVAANTNRASKDGTIHSYDLFVADDHQAGSYLKQFGKYAAGDSLRSIFDAQTRAVDKMLEVHEGDLLSFPWTGQKIEILFIDVAKTWELNDFVVREFFPSLIPGHSIVIQQDYVHPTCPWLAITMEYFSEYFEPVAFVPGNSMVYLCKKALPPALLAGGVVSRLADAEKLALMDQAVERCRQLLPPEYAVDVEAARCILRLWLLGVDDAQRELRRIKRVYEGVPTLDAAVRWIDMRIRSHERDAAAQHTGEAAAHQAAAIQPRTSVPIGDRFKKFLNPEYSMENMDLYLIRKNILDALTKLLPEFAGTLLDLGCGQMPYRQYIVSNSAITQYIGLDIDNPLHHETVKPDLYWDGKKIPLEENSVDVVIATELFEHLPDIQGVLHEVQRVLKPGGVLFFTVPYQWPLHETPHDEYRYTPFSLERHMKAAHLSDISLKPTGGWDASLAQMIGLWARRRPMTEEERRKYSEMYFPIFQSLVESEKTPDTFTEGLMITGITGTARKAGASEAGVAAAMRERVNDISLAIFTPNLGTLSETFIKKQIDFLAPGKTVVVYANMFNPQWICAPTLQVPGSEGPAVYAHDVEEKVVAFLRQHSVTHILVEYGCYGTEIVELNARRLGLPIWVHFHGADASKSLRAPEMAAYYKWMGERVTGVVTVAEPMTERLVAIGVPKEKITINHYGIEIPPSVTTEPEKEPCRFIFVGRLVAKKAPDLLLKAFAIAHAQYPGMHLDIVGGDFREGVVSQVELELKKFVDEHDLAGAVTLHGAVKHDKVKELLSRASVYVQHSVTVPETGDAEGLPNTILEACAYALPVISTRHEGIPEEIEHGTTGFLGGEFDCEEMAEFMLRLAKDPALRKKMGRAGKAKIEQDFSVEHYIRGLRSILFGGENGAC